MPYSTWSTRCCACTARLIGPPPRRSATSTGVGFTVPRAPRNYVSWAAPPARGLPEPEAFVHERFKPGSAKPALPRVLGPLRRRQTVCIGKRFGQIEVKLVTTDAAAAARADACRGTMTVRQSPRLAGGGLKMRLRNRPRLPPLGAPKSSPTPLRCLDRSRPPGEEFFLERLAPALDGIDEVILLGDLFASLRLGRESVDASAALLALLADVFPAGASSSSPATMITTSSTATKRAASSRRRCPRRGAA